MFAAHEGRSLNALATLNAPDAYAAAPFEAWKRKALRRISDYSTRSGNGPARYAYTVENPWHGGATTPHLHMLLHLDPMSYGSKRDGLITTLSNLAHQHGQLAPLVDRLRRQGVTIPTTSPRATYDALVACRETLSPGARKTIRLPFWFGFDNDTGTELDQWQAMNGLRYISKGTDPSYAFIWRGRRHTLADFDRNTLADMGRPTEFMWSHEKQSPNRPKRSTGISYSLGPDEQSAAGFDLPDTPLEEWLVPIIATDRLLQRCRDFLRTLTSAAVDEVAADINTAARKAPIVVFWLDDDAVGSTWQGYDRITVATVDGVRNRRSKREKMSNNSALAPPLCGSLFSVGL